jgi:excisionase family DNA binding protein
MQPTRPPKKPFISIATAADELGLSPETVRKAVHRGEIPSIRIGHVFRIPREALDSWRKRVSA